jgi:hypothetical protein
VHLHVCHASREHHVARKLGRTIMPNFLTIIGRAIAARLERMYQAHMERAQMRLAPSPMAMCTERPHVSTESDSRVRENKSQTTRSGDHFCLVLIDESGSVEATGARGGDIGIGNVQDVPNAGDILFQPRPLLASNCHSPRRRARTRRSLNWDRSARSS